MNRFDQRKDLCRVGPIKRKSINSLEMLQHRRGALFVVLLGNHILGHHEPQDELVCKNASFPARKEFAVECG